MYSAREKNVFGVSGKDLAAAVKGVPAAFIGKLVSGGLTVTAQRVLEIVIPVGDTTDPRLKCCHLLQSQK